MIVIADLIFRIDSDAIALHGFVGVVKGEVEISVRILEDDSLHLCSSSCEFSEY